MSMPNKLFTPLCSCCPDSCEVVVAPFPVVEGNSWAGRSDFELEALSAELSMHGRLGLELRLFRALPKFPLRRCIRSYSLDPQGRFLGKFSWKCRESCFVTSIPNFVYAVWVIPLKPLLLLQPTYMSARCQRCLLVRTAHACTMTVLLKTSRVGLTSRP